MQASLSLLLSRQKQSQFFQPLTDQVPLISEHPRCSPPTLFTFSLPTESRPDEQVCNSQDTPEIRHLTRGPDRATLCQTQKDLWENDRLK